MHKGKVVKLLNQRDQLNGYKFSAFTIPKVNKWIVHPKESTDKIPPSYDVVKFFLQYIGNTQIGPTRGLPIFSTLGTPFTLLVFL